MVSSVLSINLSAPSGSESYWIRLEQIIPAREATLQEAAETIDNLLGLDPCNPPPEDQTKEERVEEHKLTLEQIEQKLKDAEENLRNQLYGLADELCRKDDTWQAVVKVFRSHQDRAYTLLVSGGEIIQTITGLQEQKTTTIPVQESAGIDYQPSTIGQVDASWQGPVVASGYGVLDAPPQITATGSGFEFPGRFTGAVQVSQTEVYDKVTIRVTDPEGCTLTALYHLATDELELQPPPADESTEDLCREIQKKYNTPVNHGDCIKVIEHDILCNCSGGESGHSYHEYINVACPEGTAPGQVVDREKTTSFVDCGEEDSVHDPDFYQSVCCKDAPAALPRCSHTYQSYAGKGLSPSRLNDLLSIFGAGANLIPVTPSDGLCGRLVTSQLIDSKGCCDDIDDDLYFISPIPDEIYTCINVYIGGGLGPVKWQVNQGYRLASKVTNTPGGNTICLEDTSACSDLVVKITGQCGTASTQIRLAVGKEPLAFEDLDLVVAPGLTIVVTASGGVKPYMWTASGGLKIESAYEGSAVVRADDDFCGTGSVIVTDSCGDTATAEIRSTDGFWKTIELDTCDCPAGSGGVVTSYADGGNCYPDAGEVIKGRYKCVVSISAGIWDPACDPAVCGAKEFITGASDQYCADFNRCSNLHNISRNGQCCVYPDGQSEGVPLYAQVAQKVTRVMEWVCQ